MTEFPVKYQPEYSASKSITFRVLKAQFGDGYKQLVGDGINTLRHDWSLSFTYPTEDIDVIEEFLIETKGTEPFLWTPPRGIQDVYRVSDAGFKREVANFGYERISVIFERV